MITNNLYYNYNTVARWNIIIVICTVVIVVEYTVGDLKD